MNLTEIVEFFEKLFKSLKPSTAIATIFLIFVVIGLGDYIFGFSASYFQNKSIEEIAKIQTILESEKLDSTVRRKLLIQQRQIAYQEDFASRANRMISFIQSTINRPINTAIKNNNDNIKFNFWHWFSSGWICYFGMIIFVFLPILAKDFSLTSLFAITVLELFTFAIAYTFGYFFLKIPIIVHPVINYILNAYLHFVMINLIYRISIGIKDVFVDKIKRKIL